MCSNLCCQHCWQHIWMHVCNSIYTNISKHVLIMLGTCWQERWWRDVASSTWVLPTSLHTVLAVWSGHYYSQHVYSLFNIILFTCCQHFFKHKCGPSSTFKVPRCEHEHHVSCLFAHRCSLLWMFRVAGNDDNIILFVHYAQPLTTHITIITSVSVVHDYTLFEVEGHLPLVGELHITIVKLFLHSFNLL